MGNSARLWNTMLTGRLLAGTPSIDFPRMRMSPEVGCSKPAIMRIRVVLPQPEGPRIEKNSPGATLKLTSSTAACEPKRLVTLTMSRSVEEAMTLPIQRVIPQCELGDVRHDDQIYEPAFRRSRTLPSISSRPAGTAGYQRM